VTVEHVAWRFDAREGRAPDRQSVAQRLMVLERAGLMKRERRVGEHLVYWAPVSTRAWRAKGRAPDEPMGGRAFVRPPIPRRIGAMPESGSTDEKLDRIIELLEAILEALGPDGNLSESLDYVASSIGSLESEVQNIEILLQEPPPGPDDEDDQ
jgi:hypothetical protein